MTVIGLVTIPFSLPIGILSIGGGCLSIAYPILNKNKFEKFFKSVKFYNAAEEIPQLINKQKTDYGYDYIFTLPIGLNLEQFKKLKLSLEQFLNAKIQLEYKDNTIIMKSFEIKLKEQYEYVFKKGTHPLEVCIGYTAQGPKMLRLKQNALVCGTAGMGKSTLCRGWITSLILNNTPETLAINLVDFKRVETGIFKHCNIVSKYCVTIEELDHLLAKLENESKRRYEMFEAANVLDIESWNAKFEPLKYIVTFIDEISQIGHPKENKTSEHRFTMLTKRLSYDRAAGIFYVISTQRPSVDIITGSIKANIDIRISFKTVDSTNSWIVLDDQEAAQYLSCPGRGLLKEVGDLIEFQAPYLSETEAIKLIKQKEGDFVLTLRDKRLIEVLKTKEMNTQEIHDEFFHDCSPQRCRDRLLKLVNRGHIKKRKGADDQYNIFYVEV